MEILDLIDELEEIVIQARRLPVGGNLVVDRKRILDVIDQMRLALPADVLEAKRVLETREELVAEAEARARLMIEQADAERARRLDEDSILREARARSHTPSMAAAISAATVSRRSSATRPRSAWRRLEPIRRS